MESEAVPAGRTGDPEPHAGQEERASPLELFFDLVFVFAFTQVTGLMSADPTWEGVGEGMLILAAVWWAWGAYAWLTNALNSDDGIARFGLFAAMAAMLVAALALPEAFGDDAVLFGCAYFAVRVLHIAVYTYGAPEVDVRDAILTLAPGLLGAPALLIVAGFLDGTAQVGVWIGALVLDYGTPYLTDVSGFRVSPRHFAERFALVVIIALGESIVAVGAGLEGVALSADTIAAALAAIVIAATLWWAYFDITAIAIERRLSEVEGIERNRLARDALGVIHGLLIAGIVLVALGIKKTLGDVDEPLETVPAFALCGGVAVYLIGHVCMRFRSVHTINRRRLGVAILSLALIPYTTAVDALAAIFTVAALLTALIAYEGIRYRDQRTRWRAGTA
jgi:low temperature requirement protein LtrA